MAPDGGLVIGEVHTIRRRAVNALGALLERLSHKTPLVLHLDDLQWGGADDAALLIELLGGSNAGPRVLWLGSYRTEVKGHAPFLELMASASQQCETIELGPLGESDAAELARALLPDGDGIRVDMDPVQFDYRPSAFRVIDNGHTVQVNVAAGNFIDVMGRRFELKQFHFHRPSEERIEGKQFDMVAHLVHQDLEGRLAVVAVLLERGGAQALVQTVWNNLPLEKGEELAARATLDLNHLLPKDPRYFTYMGSLTTPPCSEGVLWMVMQQPVTVSSEQIEVFARLYPMNARPLQQASGRLIKQSN
jgi:carbonic anhydrase